MRVKISHFVGVVDGRTAYETSSRVHSDTALICLVYDPQGVLQGRYVNPPYDGLNCPRGFTVRAFPACRFMTEHVDRKPVPFSYTGGVTEE